MPAQYEAIRDKLAKKMPLAEAKSHAAAIYNSKHKERPVTGKMEYAKGGDVADVPMARGGKVLRTQNSQFLKTPDEFRDSRNRGSDEDWGKGSKKKGT